MKSFQANDLRNLVTEVVSAYKAEKHQWLLESPEVLREGVFDPGILKAIFTAGGPGSGKSFVADMLMGARSLEKPYQKYFEKNTSYLPAGIKYVNSDNLFEKGLRKMGINPKDLADIESLPSDELWDIIQGYDPESIRNVAKTNLKSSVPFMRAVALGFWLTELGESTRRLRDKKKRWRS
jgi:Cdc6-like AAA superfamily ATPase